MQIRFLILLLLLSSTSPLSTPPPDPQRRSITKALPLVLLAPPYFWLAKEAVSKLDRGGLTYAPQYTKHVQHHLTPLVQKSRRVLEVGAGSTLWSLNEAKIYG